MVMELPCFREEAVDLQDPKLVFTVRIQYVKDTSCTSQRV